MTERHWTAGAPLPPADYAPREPDSADWDQFLRAKGLEPSAEREAAIDRFVRGIFKAIALATVLIPIIVLVLMWLVMRG